MSEAFNPDDRQLCPDGACIGLIGPDGRCKECGAEGTASRPGSRNGARDSLGWIEPPRSTANAGVSTPDGRFDPDVRELCPDSTCIGLIGPDGRCKECGQVSLGAGLDPRSRGLRTEDEIAAELEVNITKGDLSPAPEDLAERQLCPDGACIGLIGPDGRCKECGTRAG